MFDALVAGLTSFANPTALLFMVVGVVLGSVFGLIPGLSGLTALALLLPFTYGMDPAVGLSFLLATHAVVNTGGSVTAILLGIPGTPACTATVIDGYPMAQQGRGGEAVGAALAASALGGLVGAVVLFALLPVLIPVVLYFQSPETLMIAVFGIALISMLSQGDMVKGLAAGAFGMFLAMFGYHSVTGVPRFWLDFDYLLDGFRLIPVALGLFAVPEIISLGHSGKTIAGVDAKQVSVGEVWAGVMATFRRWFLVIKSSAIGVVIGIIPGLGGETAPWLAYASAAQGSKNRDEFGRGAIEGVIAPEASNNSKEGGALVPTLAFAVPGSSAMALLIGAFFLFGLEAGPEFLKKHMDVAIHLSVTLAISNVLAAVALILLGRYLANVTRIPGGILAPLLMVTLILGTHSAYNEPWDVWFLLIFGVLGFLLKEFNYSRPALLLGYVLAPMVENYAHITLQAHGWGFLLRPVPMAVILAILATMLWPTLRKRRRGAGA